jgi:hypothetical protein
MKVGLIRIPPQKAARHVQVILFLHLARASPVDPLSLFNPFLENSYRNGSMILPSIFGL